MTNLGKTHVSIMGGGVMGEALIQRLVDGSLYTASQITVSDLNTDRLQFLKKKYKIGITTNNAEAVRAGNIVILAVKPQQAQEVLYQMRSDVCQGQLFISIMAGVPLVVMQKILGTGVIVRSMPNTPSQIGKGVVVWHAAEAVNARQKHIARAIFAALGYEQEVTREDLIDKATAVSGSGPAYVFYFASCLIDAARTLGFSEETARYLVVHTLIGSSELLFMSPESPSVLRERVTSKGGTTEAAFEIIEHSHFEKVLKNAVKKAYKRAKKISALIH